MRRGRLITLLVFLGAALGVASVAAASSNRVAASLTNISKPGKMRLTIRRNGGVAYSQAVRSPACGSLCIPTAVGPGKSPLKIVDLNSDGQPEVILGLYSGGAHCCFVDQVFSLDPGTMTYVKAQHDFFDSDPVLKRIAGRYEFAGSDARIAEAGLTDFADSGAPVEVWRFDARRFKDVTRQFPNLIRPDAARWLRLFKHHLSNGVGLIAAWAADEDLLGNSALVSSALNTYAAQGHLRTPLQPGLSGKAAVKQIEKLLHKLGYTT
jgi:hypothetical protein